MASAPHLVSDRYQNGDPTGSKRSASQASLEVVANGKKKRFEGCSSIKNYVIMSKLGEGTFGEVHKAESRATGQIVAMKKILMHQEKDGFPVTALREIKLLKMLSHPNILKLEEMAIEHAKEGRKKATVYMVTPYMDHDLSGLLENPSVQFTEAQIKCYLLQLLEGVAYLHASKILHRDMKAANLLINNEGNLQIADFGLARPYDDPPPRAGHGNGEATRGYTTVVVTRWYRPPELLLQLRQYTPAIDMWGVGCVLGEMFKGRPILPGNSDLNQIHLIFDLMGSPSDENMPGWHSLPGCEGVKEFQTRPSSCAQVFVDEGPLFVSLLSELLNLDWRKRINAMDAIEHPYFKTAPLPAKPGEIPQFQESHELDRRKFREQKANLPPAPAGGTVGMGPEGDVVPGAGPSNGHMHGQYRSRQGPGGFHNGHQPSLPKRSGFDVRFNTQQIDSRAPPAPLTVPPPSMRKPAWAKEANGLPPRPPPSNNVGRLGFGHSTRPYDGDRGKSLTYEAGRDRAPMEGSRGRPRRDGGAGTTHPVDTYIPNYARKEDVRRDGNDDYRNRGEGKRRDDRADWRPGEKGNLEYWNRWSKSPERERERERDRARESYRR